MSQQLSLFANLRGHSPNWDDAQKGRARWVPHDAYSRKCRKSCIWSDSIADVPAKQTCYLFHKPIINGMCPSTGELAWI